MESNEQNILINKIETDSSIKKRLTTVRGEGYFGAGEKVEGIKKKKELIDTDNSMVITRGRGEARGGGRRRYTADEW